MSEVGDELRKLEAWFAKVFVTIEHEVSNIMPLAVSITEKLKTALESGAVDFVEKAIDGFVGRPGVAEEAVGLAQLVIKKVLPIELAIQGIPTNPSPEDVSKFAQQVISSFTTLTTKDKLYTNLAAQIYRDIQAQKNLPITPWAKAIAVIEEGYTQYKELDN